MSSETPDSLTIRPRPAARRQLGVLRRPPDGHRRRDHRAAGAGSRRRRHRHHRQDPARLRPDVGSACSTSAGPRRRGGPLSTLGDDWDNDDVRVPARRGSRPRTKTRPSHTDAVERLRHHRRPRPVHLPGRGGHQARACGHRDAGQRARPPGGRGRRSGGPRRRHRRRAGHPGPDRPDRPPAQRAARGPPTTPTSAERVLVANADQLVIVCALADPVPRTGFIDRCLVAAYTGNLDAVLVLTKADLADPGPLEADLRRPGSAHPGHPASRRRRKRGLSTASTRCGTG